MLRVWFWCALQRELGRRTRTDTAQLGIFESQSDIGKVNPPGTASFDPASGAYTVASAGCGSVGGERWIPHGVEEGVGRRFADCRRRSWRGVGRDRSPHRKALLMFRQTLDPDSMYADAAMHGTGETALQYRRNKGDTTQDIAFNIGAPQTVRLEKRGDTITLFLSMKGEPLHQVGASIKLHFAEPISTQG